MEMEQPVCSTQLPPCCMSSSSVTRPSSAEDSGRSIGKHVRDDDNVFCHFHIGSANASTRYLVNKYRRLDMACIIHTVAVSRIFVFDDNFS